MTTVVVTVTRRPGIADPEGVTVAKALRDLGFTSVAAVGFGRTITLEIDEEPAAAAAAAAAMCEKLLANPVIEDYDVRVLP